MFFGIILVLIITHSPAIALFLIGYNIRNRKPKTTKVLYIIATVYTLIGLGICGTLLISF